MKVRTKHLFLLIPRLDIMLLNEVVSPVPGPAIMSFLSEPDSMIFCVCKFSFS